MRASRNRSLPTLWEPYVSYVTTPEIKARGARLTKARLHAGFKKRADAIKRFRWNPNSYNPHEAGNIGFGYNTAKKYADAYGVRADWLYSGDGPMLPNVQPVPLIGKVAAEEAADIVYEDAYTQGDAADWLDALPPEGSIALEVAQASMVPRFNPGEVLIFGPRAADPSSLIGREVMAKLADGRAVVKILRKGTRAGRYTLESYNRLVEPIENAKIEWVLPFEQLRPRP